MSENVETMRWLFRMLEFRPNATELIENIFERCAQKHPEADSVLELVVLIVVECAIGRFGTLTDYTKDDLDAIQERCRKVVQLEIERLLIDGFWDLNQDYPSGFHLEDTESIAADITRLLAEGACACGGVEPKPKFTNTSCRRKYEECEHGHALSEFSGGLHTWENFLHSAVLGEWGMLRAVLESR